MFQAISEDPQTLLPTKEQTALFVDPALGWVSNDLPWKLRGSVGITDLGKTWDYDPLYPEATDMALGFGVEPPVKFGRLRLGLDLINLFKADDLFSRVRFGTSYKFGIMEAMAGFNKHSLTGGMEFGIQVVQVGIVYEFVRDDFGGTSPDSKISTEVAIKL